MGESSITISLRLLNFYIRIHNKYSNVKSSTVNECLSLIFAEQISVSSLKVW